MRIKHSTGAAALIHEGRTFEPEDDGYFRVPFDLAQTLLRHPEWEAEPATVVVPDAPAVEDVPPHDPPKEPGDPSVPNPDTDDLTPAQKAAITRAANKAAAEAEAAK